MDPAGPRHQLLERQTPLGGGGAQPFQSLVPLRVGYPTLRATRFRLVVHPPILARYTCGRQPFSFAARASHEFGYWQASPKHEIEDQLAGFADSVAPVRDAGPMDLVSDDHVVSDGVCLVPSPGHMPFHVSVVIESRGQTAVITGDAMHHPCQIANPNGERPQTSILTRPAPQGRIWSSGSPTLARWLLGLTSRTR